MRTIPARTDPPCAVHQLAESEIGHPGGVRPTDADERFGFERTLSGSVETDESFIGGRAGNMHKGKSKAKRRGAVG